MNNYIKKIEKYIASNKKPAKAAKQSKGLLSPTNTKEVNTKNVSMDVVAQMAEFVMEIRNKRMELKNEKS
jgi:hypothetical protein